MPYSEADRADLIALAELAGVDASPGFFRIVTDLLALHVSPEDIYNLLCQIGPLNESKEQGNGATATRPLQN